LRCGSCLNGLLHSYAAGGAVHSVLRRRTTCVCVVVHRPANRRKVRTLHSLVRIPLRACWYVRFAPKAYEASGCRDWCGEPLFHIGTRLCAFCTLALAQCRLEPPHLAALVDAASAPRALPNSISSCYLVVAYQTRDLVNARGRAARPAHWLHLACDNRLRSAILTAVG